MRASIRVPVPPGIWRGKALLRLLLLLVAAAVVAAFASRFGVSHDYAYLHASLLSGVSGGHYHTLATRLAARAQQKHGSLAVVSTQGSVENITRLTQAGRGCVPAFALVQDGMPVPTDAGLEMLGRLPEPESLLLLGRHNHALLNFADLHNASIGIGPEGSGTAYLVRQLFEDPDLRGLGVRLSNHDLEDQARLVGEGKLDLAAFVMQEDAELIRTVINEYDLDIATFQDLEGLVARHPWLALGHIPAGRYDLVRPTPAADKPVIRVETLVVANPCARRAERIALLMLLSAELPGFVQANPPKYSYSATALPLATEARQYFIKGEPELADIYFPWLVDLMSPAYWVYLVMAATTVASTAGTAASGAVSSAGSLASGVAQQVSPKGLVDQLEETLTSSGDPTQMTRAQITSEIAALAGRRVVNGNLTDQERDRLATLVAAQAGISKEEAARRVARMEQDAVTALANAEQQARKAAETAARGAAAGAKGLFSGLLLSLAGALVGAWLGTRHARVLTPHEPEYDTHTTTTVTHHAYEPAATTRYTTYEPAATTRYEPVASAPTTVHVHDEATDRIPAYLRTVSFPATKQELLRAARASNEDAMGLRRVEQLPDRSYSSLSDLTSALLATV